MGEKGQGSVVIFPFQRWRKINPFVIDHIGLGAGIFDEACNAVKNASVFNQLVADVKGPLFVIETAGLQFYFVQHVCMRALGNDVDDTARRILTIKNRCRATQEFNAFCPICLLLE